MIILDGEEDESIDVGVGHSASTVTTTVIASAVVAVVDEEVVIIFTKVKE